MLEVWVNTFGDENYFFSSLGKYLVSHAYSNAETSDLWRALSTPNISVGRVMSTWTDQPGYPIVKIDGTKISQERFYFSDSNLNEKYGRASNFSFDFEPKKQIWIIPFLYSECSISGDNIEKSDLKVKMLETTGPLDVPIAEHKFILGNFGRSGVYRVQYSLDIYRLLSETLAKNFRALPPNDRVGLLNDVFALSWSGRISDVSVVLNMTRFLANELDSVVWFTFLAEMNSLESILALSASYGHFIDYYSSLLKGLFMNLGWVERSDNQKLFHIRSLLRSRVLSLSIAFHDDESVKFALEKFQAIKLGKNDSDVTIDNIGVIYEAAALWGTEGNYNIPNFQMIMIGFSIVILKVPLQLRKID
jgi:aminopeptidase N